MPSAEYDASPGEIKKFVYVQLGLTVGFLALLFWMFDGTNADYPPIWLAIALVAVVALGAFMAERVWLNASPLVPDEPHMTEQALSIFAGQTVRKLMFCEGAILVSVFATFVADRGAWPLIIGGIPGVIVLTFEIWPSLRNITRTEAMLDSQGAESGLVDAFLDA